MYMYINLKLWRQKRSTNLGVKNVFFQKSRLITISMVFLPKSPTPHRFMHVGDTENKENNGMCVSFSICRDNRMRKHISCSVDFMSHRKYNRISIRKNRFTKNNFQRRCSPKSRTSSSITCPCEIQYFKYVAVSGCCHFHGIIPSSSLRLTDKKIQLRLPGSKGTTRHET